NLGTAHLDLAARGGPDHVDVAGQVGSARVSFEIETVAPGQQHITGMVGGEKVDLSEARTDGESRISGYLGNRPVDVIATLWPEGNFTRLDGAVGDQELHLYQHPQWDGNILTGHVGAADTNITERMVDGVIPSLTPIDYIIAAAAR
ncbi:MAG: hypothetical protein ACYCW6_29860, partial [Candidatus Xenobia bacterium]